MQSNRGVIAEVIINNFKLDYINNGRKYRVKEAIVEMVVKGSRIKNTITVLNRGSNTLIQTLQNFSI